MSNGILSKLNPSDVFNYFEELTKIPRGSGNEKGVSDYLVSFAKKNKLEVIQDKADNIIIKKPGTKGYENSKTVILQGHMDMVCEKNSDIVHDFAKDPLKLRIEGDLVKATGTTLGSDNGIAVAMSMAILASEDIPHPPIEVLLTTGEETGMGGAVALEPENIKGRTLINIDSEQEGKLLVSCSGGVRTKVNLTIDWKDACTDKSAYIVKLSGLKGGHSGMEINKGRANSNKLMGRILFDLEAKFDFDLWELAGGSKNNAIPREAEAGILIKNGDSSKLRAELNIWEGIFKNEFRLADPDVKIELKASEKTIDKVFSQDIKMKAVKLLYLIPSGIQTMSMDIQGLVESSTNLGVVTTGADTVEYDSAIRSSVRSLKAYILSQTKLAAELLGAELTAYSDYPEWQYEPDSRIRTVFIDVYKKLYGKDPEIVAIHAGVECGLFKEKFGDIDMISFGPDLLDVHTTNEGMSISSVQRTWDYLKAVLAELK